MGEPSITPAGGRGRARGGVVPDDGARPIPPPGREAAATGVRWWHIVIGLALVALLTWLAPRGKSPEFAHLSVGSVSKSKIIAPYDFEILKTPDELKREREEAAGTVLPVLAASDSIRQNYSRELLSFATVTQRMQSELSPEYLKAVDDPRHRLSPDDSVKLARLSDELFRRFGFRIGGDSWRFLHRLYQRDRESKPDLYSGYFDRILGGILLDVYSRGVVNVPKNQLRHSSGRVMVQNHGEESPLALTQLLTPGEAYARISALLDEMLTGSDFPAGAVSAGYEILQPFVVPNVVYDATETERRRQAAVAKVPLAKGLVKKDELIIDRNIRVTPEHLDKLSSLAIKRAELQLDRGGLRALMPALGQALLAAMVVFLLGIFILVLRPTVWNDYKLILVLAVVLALMHLFQVLVPVRYGWSVFLFPAAVGAMLAAILVDRAVALAAVAAMALLAGLLGGNDFTVAFSAFAVGCTALFAIKQVQTRSDIMRASFYLAGIYIPLVVAFHFLKFSAGGELGEEMALAASNAVLSPILVMGLALIFERIFGITTDLTLFELVDLNRPLLRELAINSPGTYHHSIMVGSLAEAAARAIGANALLTRVGAYYHDIGKMEHKEYFIENQEAGSPNIHDRLSPEKSAQFVIDHVRQGLELAEKHGLPPQVKAFIAEHHGRSRLAYFYAKAQRERGEEIPDDGFRYPGPSPQSRETGILMLADLVEAAVRSEEHRSPQELRETVGRLVRTRLAEGDLDRCPLTLQELGRVQEVFVQVLSGIYHQRIPYPGQKGAVGENARDEAAGETTD